MTRAQISGPTGAFTLSEQKAGYALLQRRDPKLAAKGLADPECLEAWVHAIEDGICGDPQPGGWRATESLEHCPDPKVSQ